MTLLPLHCAILQEEGHSSHTHRRRATHTTGRCGGSRWVEEKDQYTWDDGGAGQFFKVVPRIRGGRLEQQGEGATLSRAAMSYHWPLSHWGETRGLFSIVLKKKKTREMRATFERRGAKVGERCSNQSIPDVRVIDRSAVSITSCL